MFGCLYYPYIKASHKLDFRSTPYIFLGYPMNHRGYRCLNLDTNNIIISRHAVFYQTIFPFGSMTPNKAPSYTFLESYESTRPLLTTLTPHLPTHHNISTENVIPTQNSLLTSSTTPQTPLSPSCLVQLPIFGSTNQPFARSLHSTLTPDPSQPSTFTRLEPRSLSSTNSNDTLSPIP